MPKNRRQKGAFFEQMARQYLIGKGYHLLEANYYSRFGEIDIIAEKGKIVSFIEVRYRYSAAFGTPFDSITGKKQQRICRVAQLYLSAHSTALQHVEAYQFDVIGITGTKPVWEITYIQNAFPDKDIEVD